MLFGRHFTEQDKKYQTIVYLSDDFNTKYTSQAVQNWSSSKPSQRTDCRGRRGENSQCNKFVASLLKTKK